MLLLLVLSVRVVDPSLCRIMLMLLLLVLSVRVVE